MQRRRGGLALFQVGALLAAKVVEHRPGAVVTALWVGAYLSHALIFPAMQGARTMRLVWDHSDLPLLLRFETCCGKHPRRRGSSHSKSLNGPAPVFAWMVEIYLPTIFFKLPLLYKTAKKKLPRHRTTARTPGICTGATARTSNVSRDRRPVSRGTGSVGGFALASLAVFQNTVIRSATGTRLEQHTAAN